VTADRQLVGFSFLRVGDLGVGTHVFVFVYFLEWTPVFVGLTQLPNTLQS
jgi:hypothetical protein